MNLKRTWHGPACYQIKVKGRLGSQWSEWFEGMTISYEEGVTAISGRVADQAALHGLLVRIRDLGLQLISVTRIDSTKSSRKGKRK